MTEVSPLALQTLGRTYEKVAARWHYAGGDADTLAKACRDSLDHLPPNRRIVAFALGEFFGVLSFSDRPIAEGGMSWAQLNAAIFEAVRYVEKGTEQLDAIHITDAVNMARLAWCGE